MPKSYYHYCPNCKTEGIKETDVELIVSALGTDGYGQPVRFTECECGSVLNGFLYLTFYEQQGQTIDDGFIGYLKHRINFYYEGFQENEERIRTKYHKKLVPPTEEEINERIRLFKERYNVEQ